MEMISSTIKDNFAGRLMIFGFDCFFAFSSGYSLKIIPKTEDIDLFSAKCKERRYNFDSLGWIHAVDDWGYDVAFLLSEKQIPMSYHKETLTLITDIFLQTPNAKDRDGYFFYDCIDLKGFTAIDFVGEAINSVFSPKSIIADDSFKSNHIEWLSTAEYAKAFPIELYGKKCSLILSVMLPVFFHMFPIGGALGNN